MNMSGSKLYIQNEHNTHGDQRHNTLLPTGTFKHFLPLDYIYRSLRRAGIGYWRIFVKDDGRLALDVNDSFLALTGRGKDDFPGNFHNFLHECIHPDDRQVTSDTILMKNGDSNSYDFISRILNQQLGQWRWVHCFGEATETFGDGRPRIIFGCIIDVHEAHEARLDLAQKEAALRQERQRIDSIIDAAGLIFWDWDLTTETVRYGDSVYGSKGLSEPTPITTSWLKAMRAEDREKALEARQRHLDGESDHYEVELQIRRPDSEFFWVRDRGRVVEWDQDGRPVRMMGAAIDVSERRAADLALNESRQRLEQLMEAADIAVWDLNVAENTLSINNNYSRILGLEKTELENLGDKWLDYLHPDDIEYFQAGFDALINGRQGSLRLEYRLRNKKGEYIWFYCLIKAIGQAEDGRPAHVVGAQIDFTDKKRLEARQAHSMAVISRQNSELGYQLSERSAMLKDIQGRMETLLETPSARLEPLQKKLKEEMDRLADKLSVDGLESNGSAARYMQKAFQYVGNEMVWYKAILDNLPFPLSVFDLNHKWTYLNRPAADTIGTEDWERLIGRSYHQGWKDVFDTNISGENEAGKRKIFIRQLPQTGKFYLCQNSLLKDQHGQDIGFIETMQDITSAYEADSRMRLMMDATPLASVVFSHNGELIDCNRQATLLCGLTDKQQYLDRFFDCLAPTLEDGRPTATVILSNVHEAFSSGSSFIEHISLRDIHGQDIPGEVFLTRVAWGDSFIVLAYFRDLREIQSARRELDRERLLLKDIMEGCPVAFAMGSSEKIILTNPFARKTLGLDVNGRIDEIIVGEEDLKHIRQSLEKHLPVNWQPLRVRTAEKEIIDTLLNAYSAEYENQSVWMTWLMDVTELKKKEKQLQEAVGLAEASTRAKSDFLANISHEIRTPMNAIIGLNHLLLQTELSDQQREYVVKGDTASKSLLFLINDILDFSKIEAGKLDLARTEFNLAELLVRSVDLFAPQAFSKGLEFILRTSDNLPLYYIGDDFRISQIINNLLSNAVKFTDRGVVRLDVELASESAAEVELRFLVRDTGIGLKSSQAEKIFSAFTQADNSHTRRYGGSGLGLAICKQLVNLMRGEIWCESVPGQGSCFGFTIHLGRSRQKERYLGPHAAFEGLTVLAVDDSADSLESARLDLGSLGFKTVTAAGGAEALEVARQLKQQGRKIDLILVDRDMPGLDGRRTIEALRKLLGPKNSPPAALVVGSGLKLDDHEKRKPAWPVLAKPFLALNLVDLLTPILENSEKSYNAARRRLPDEEDSAGLVKHLAGARILLVEDNEVNQLVAGKILQKAGFNVTMVDNGQLAVDMLRNGPDFDLVLMDIQMPVMDGLAAAAEIRKDARFKNLPIVAMTAHATDQDRLKSLAVGMNDHITKPLDISSLFKCLAKWIPEAGRGAINPDSPAGEKVIDRG